MKKNPWNYDNIYMVKGKSTYNQTVTHIAVKQEFGKMQVIVN